MIGWKSARSTGRKAPANVSSGLRGKNRTKSLRDRHRGMSLQRYGKVPLFFKRDFLFYPKICNRNYLSTKIICTKKIGKFFGIPRQAQWKFPRNFHWSALRADFAIAKSGFTDEKKHWFHYGLWYINKSDMSKLWHCLWRKHYFEIRFLKCHCEARSAEAIPS